MLVILIPSLVVRMAVAYPSYGCVTLIMIAVMIRMNLLTCAVNATALLVGKDVPVNRIIVVFLNGCSVMAKTIAVTIVTNCLRIAPLAIWILISNVATTDVYQSRFIPSQCR